MSQHIADSSAKPLPKHHVHTVGRIGFEHTVRKKTVDLRDTTVHFWPLLSALVHLLSVRRSVSPQPNVVEAPRVHLWIRINLITNNLYKQCSRNQFLEFVVCFIRSIAAPWLFFNGGASNECLIHSSFILLLVGEQRLILIILSDKMYTWRIRSCRQIGGMLLGLFCSSKPSCCVVEIGQGETVFHTVLYDLRDRKNVSTNMGEATTIVRTTTPTCCQWWFMTRNNGTSGTGRFYLWFSIGIFVLFCGGSIVSTGIWSPPPPSSSSFVMNNPYAPPCTAAQLRETARQLPAHWQCRWYRRKHQCAISVATQCPVNDNWLVEHYRQQQQANDNNNNNNNFLAINVGCNKGFDAIDLLRMATRDPAVQKKAWKDALVLHQQQSGAPPMKPGTCHQDEVDDRAMIVEAVPAASSSSVVAVHCLEPIQSTVQALQTARNITGYDDLVIFQVALAKESGTALFPVQVEVGRENIGLGRHPVVPLGHTARLAPVEVLTLDDYVQQHITRINLPPAPPTDADQLQHHQQPPAPKQQQQRTINVLLIDVEGFDFDVLQGGRETLHYVEYLEFEFHDKGQWRHQALRDAIQYLAESYHFTCYWAGVRKLWRITDCWHDHYKVHQWSNVACVASAKVPALAERMERVFRATIHKEEEEEALSP
jgi:Methyltransferase FkbM domain